MITTTPYDDLEGDEHADYQECNCDFRPYKDPSNPWSLQRALALQFGLFLNKNHTCSNWGAGIDLQLGTWKFHNDKLRREQRQIREELELYAINDVIAVWFIMIHQKLYKLNKKRGRRRSTDDSLTSTTVIIPSENRINRTVSIGTVFYTPVTEPVTPTSDFEVQEKLTIVNHATETVELSVPSVMAQRIPIIATTLQNTQDTPMDLDELPVGDRVFSGPTDMPDLTIVPSSENQPRNSIAIQKRPSYLILADSHLKHLPERLRQPNYDVDIKIVRGAEWINQYDPKLSIQSIISLLEIIEAVSRR
ncbi:unnamed protein product [Didymodactylos carnosus]|uniref:Uncharacterized protein n=1 Tax=Didymodactylos carnosus TaxID=1234261 RepID=A0A815RQK7_9BILA|nr:unnamed protein product [Didymodactylos carnosus]CAF1480973.1 unnamed protein product [Didymodactylos carnosus]CAF3772435.1 unnamed protein product [Didymodactylos carnosus]CAF4346079.1 unnamed protein product [Didymodactylos carnosus]